MTPEEFLQELDPRHKHQRPKPVGPPPPRPKRRRSPLEHKVRRVLGGMLGGFVALWSVVAGVPSVLAAGDRCDGYTVEPGDTLWGIGEATGNDITWLVELNDLPDPDLIVPGQCLRVAAEGGTYNVERGARYMANSFVGDGPSPGAIVLGDALQIVYPEFGRSIHDRYGIGIWNVRAVRGGTVLSTHASGLALDFYVHCDARADDLFDRLESNAEQLGVERVVMCDRTWRVDRGEYVPSDYLAGLHDGRLAPAHAHIELTRAAGAGLTYAEAISALSD